MSGNPNPAGSVIKVMLIVIGVITVAGVAAIALAEIYGKGC